MGKKERKKRGFIVPAGETHLNEGGEEKFLYDVALIEKD